MSSAKNFEKKNQMLKQTMTNSHLARPRRGYSSRHKDTFVYPGDRKDDEGSPCATGCTLTLDEPSWWHLASSSDSIYQLLKPSQNTARSKKRERERKRFTTSFPRLIQACINSYWKKATVRNWSIRSRGVSFSFTNPSYLILFFFFRSWNNF